MPPPSTLMEMEAKSINEIILLIFSGVLRKISGREREKGKWGTKTDNAGHVS